MIINSLLDNDFYKFTMQQLILHQYPSTWVKYKFKCRNKTQLHKSISVPLLKKEIDHLCSLRFTEDELCYLLRIPFLSVDYIDYLEMFKLNSKYININIYNDELEITIEGPWLATILFEVPILAIISELYGKYISITKINLLENGKKRLNEKISYLENIDKNLIENFKFADFGTRRRFSHEFHENVLVKLKNELPNNIIGTSNLYFSMKLNLKYIGTHAHEYIMAHQNLTNSKLINFQKNALESWVKEYRGNLGIALSDTIGLNSFLRDFDLYYSKLFDGIRQDSGNPFECGHLIVQHYKNHNIDPKSKSIIFSDGLNFELAIKLLKTFFSKIKTVFGIGTFLSNDVGINPLNIVIKLVECNKKPVAKISDSVGKSMCEDDSYLQYLESVFELKYCIKDDEIKKVKKLLKSECVTCNVKEKRSLSIECNDCPFSKNGYTIGFKNTIAYGLYKHVLYYFLYNPDLNWRFPKKPDNCTSKYWHVHHRNGNHYDDRFKNLCLLLSSDHRHTYFINNNPMKNKNVSEKVSIILKNKYKNKDHNFYINNPSPNIKLKSKLEHWLYNLKEDILIDNNIIEKIGYKNKYDMLTSIKRIIDSKKLNLKFIKLKNKLNNRKVDTILSVIKN